MTQPGTSASTAWTTAPSTTASSNGSERTEPHSTGQADRPGTTAAPSAGCAPETLRLLRRPSAAEWARTLMLGVVPGTLVLPTEEHHEDGTLCAAGPPSGSSAGPGADRQRRGGTAGHPVQHLTDTTGGLLLLVDDDSPLATRLLELTSRAARASSSGSAGYGVPAALDVLDVPPGRSGLPRARLCVTGWVESVGNAEQRALAADVAGVRPLGALLDVGSTRRLWRLEVADVRVTVISSAGAEVHLLDEEDLATATPDPLYAEEDSVVAHLEHHHRDALVGWVLAELPVEQATRVREVSVLGADRYGLDVLCTVGTGTLTLRGAFASPVGPEHPLGAALCRLFACPCGGRSHEER